METHIAGIINGTKFTCEGSGTSEFGTGTSSAVIKFSNSIPNFTPVLCKSWKCNTHPPVAQPPEGEENFFKKLVERGEKIHTFTIIRYPFAQDQLLCTSVCYRPQTDRQVVHQTRMGTYSGPIDIVSQKPFEEYIEPCGNGKAIALSEREVVRSNGEIIRIKYHTEMFFPKAFRLPYVTIIRNEGTAVWSNEKLTFTLNTISKYRTDKSSSSPILESLKKGMLVNS